MLAAASRAVEGGGDACLVVIAHGCKVEAWVVHDLGSQAEHVADWHLDGMVVGLCVAPVEERGFLVTSASDVGVGWSWIESTNWTVVGTQFQEISPDPHPSKVPPSPRAAPVDSSAAAAVTGTDEAASVDEAKAQVVAELNVNMHSSQGSVCFLPHASVSLISLEHRVFLSCIVTTFNQAMRVATALCFATELGYASKGRGAAPYRQLLFSQDRHGNALASGGVSVSNSFAGSLRDSQHFSSNQPIASGLGANINRGENDRCIVIVRQETVSEFNDTVVVEVKNVIHDTCALRWCELECEGVPDGDTQGEDVSVNVLGVKIHTHAGRAHLAAQAGNKSLRSDHSNDNTGGLLRVIWELVLPPGASWCTEPYNNDGRDNRKLLYVSRPTGTICVYNVNGIVGTFSMNAAAEGIDMSSCGAVVGVMVQRLPLTDENRRLVVAATTSGKYLEIQLDDVGVIEDEGGSALMPDRYFTSIKSVPVLPIADKSYDGHAVIPMESIYSAPILPYAQTMMQLSPPITEETVVPDGTGCVFSFLAFHPNFGMQLLSSTSTYNDGNGDMPGATSIADNNTKDELGPTSGAEEEQTPQFMLQASDCFSSSALSRLCDVQRMDVLRSSIHNKNIPDRIVACCASVPVLMGPAQAGDASASLQSVIYTCEFGAALVAHAEASVELSPELLGGVRLLGVSHANIWGLSAAATRSIANTAQTKTSAENTGTEDDERSRRDRFWPVIITSRILNQSGLVALDVTKNSIADEVPAYMKIIEDKPTVSFVPIGGNGLKHSGLAVQVTSDTLRLVYLEELPDIIRNYTCTFQTETTTGMLGCATAPNPLPQENDTASKVESLEDYSVPSDSDSELSTTDEDEPAIDEAIMGDDDDCDVRSTDSSNTKDVKTREKKRRARVERMRVRAEQQTKLTNREKGRLKMILEKENRRKEKEAHTAQSHNAWSIEMTGELGDHLALAGKGQLVVVQLKPPATRMLQQPVAPVAPPASVAGMSRNATRQFVRVKLVGEQVPFALKYRQRLSGQIAALGSMLWQGQRVIACSYWGQEVIDIFKCPDELNPPVPTTAADAEEAPVQNLEKVARISLPTASTSNDDSNFIQHLQVIPLASSNEVAVQDLTHPDIPSAVNSTAAAARVTTADKLRNRVAASKGKSNAAAPINSVFAVIGGTLSGSVFVYYVYMRQNKDLSVRNWEVYFHQHHRTNKRILGLESIDTRQANMATRPHQPNENHGEGLVGNQESNGSAVKIHASDGHYLLHFAKGHSPIDVMAHQPGWESHLSDGGGRKGDGASLDLAMDIGAVHEEYEYSLHAGAKPHTSSSDAQTTTIQEEEKEEKAGEDVRVDELDPRAVKKEKRAKRVLGIRQGLLSEADAELAAAYARNKVVTDQSLARRALLPKAIRGHCWSWIPLVIHNQGLGVSHIMQIPGHKSGGGNRHGEHNKTRMLLADLGFTWLMPAMTNDAERSREVTGAGCILCTGAPADQPPKFYPQKRTTVPGRVISIQVNDDKSKLVLAWTQEHEVSISTSSSSSATQGLCVLDAKNLKCLWNTTYQRWYSASAFLNNDGVIATEADIAAPVGATVTAASGALVQNQGPGPALGAIRSQRAAAIKLEQDKKAQAETWRIAVDKAMQVLGSTAAFANTSSGHRELDAVLEGLPPVATDNSMASIPSLSDCFTTLHRTTVNVAPFLDEKTPEGLSPLPKVATCFVISVFAFTKSTSLENANTNSKGSESSASSSIALQALGSMGYECRGAVKAMTIDTSIFKHTEGAAFGSDSQNCNNASSDLQTKDPKYLIMAGETDVTIIGWKLATDVNTKADQTDNATEEREGEVVATKMQTTQAQSNNQPNSRLALGVLCKYNIDLGCVMSVTAGASHGHSCKLFISHVRNAASGGGSKGSHPVHMDPSKSRLVSSIQILTLSLDAHGTLSITPERNVSMPGGPVSHLAPSAVFSPKSNKTEETRNGNGTGSDTGFRIEQSLPERGISISAIDHVTASAVTAHFHLDKEAMHTTSAMSTSSFSGTAAVRGPDTGADSSDDERTLPIKKAADMHISTGKKTANVVKNSNLHAHVHAATRVMEREAVADMEKSFSLEEASVAQQHHPLPEGLLSSQVLLHRSVAVIAAPTTAHKANSGTTSTGTDTKSGRDIGLLWALLDSTLDWHVRGEQPANMGG